LRIGVRFGAEKRLRFQDLPVRTLVDFAFYDFGQVGSVYFY